MHHLPCTDKSQEITVLFIQVRLLNQKTILTLQLPSLYIKDQPNTAITSCEY